MQKNPQPQPFAYCSSTLIQTINKTDVGGREGEKFNNRLVDSLGEASRTQCN